MASGPDSSDFFDLLPDPILLLILNRVSDIKTLLRCRSVSKRFNSAVPQADSLLLRVDRVISSSDEDDGVSFLSALFKSLLTSLHHLVSPPPTGKQPPENPITAAPPPPNSPSQILRSFDAIASLRIELPSGDLRLEKGTSIKWVARFGKTLRSCVILAFKNGGDSTAAADNGGGGGGGLKMRVVWTISALIAASARHFMISEVVREQHSLSRLVVYDRDNEGTVIMDKDGLTESRESGGEAAEETNPAGGGGGMWWRNNRTTVPAVGMRMRHEAKMELSGGMVLEGATLVVVRPVGGGGGGGEDDDEWLVEEAFGKEGVWAEAVQRLIKSRSYILEMNSF